MKYVLFVTMILSSNSIYSQKCLDKLQEEMAELSSFSPDDVESLEVNDNCDVKITMGNLDLTYYFNLGKVTIPAQTNIISTNKYSVHITCNGFNCVIVNDDEDSSIDINFMSKESGDQFIFFLNEVYDCCKN